MNEPRHFPAFDRACDTLEAWRIECGSPRGWVFWMLAGTAVVGLAALPVVRVNVTVRAPGVVRPVAEPVEVRATAGGVIARVLVRDEAVVVAGEPLLELAAPEIDGRRQRLARRLAELEREMADLTILTAHPGRAVWTGGGDVEKTGVAALGVALGEERGAAGVTDGSAPAEDTAFGAAPPGLTTALYTSDAAQLAAQRATAATERRRLVRDGERARRLHARGLLSERELDHARFAVEQGAAADEALVAQAQARWHAALRQAVRERAELATEDRLLAEAKARCTVRAPTGGDLLGFTGWCAGAFLVEGQPLGTISPEGALRVEAAVRSRDLAMLEAGQPARIEIDAYPATEWGFIDGAVDTIARDARLNGAMPYHRLGVSLSTTRDPAAAGRTGRTPVLRLRKGMGATVRVVVGRRSLWHFLTETLDQWASPDALAKIGAISGLPAARAVASRRSVACSINGSGDRRRSSMTFEPSASLRGGAQNDPKQPPQAGHEHA